MDPNYNRRFCITTDIICGAYPVVDINYKYSKKIDILKQATNSILRGDDTFYTALRKIEIMLKKHNRLGTLNSQATLKTKFRRLIRKADIYKQHTKIYAKQPYKTARSIIQEAETALKETEHLAKVDSISVTEHLAKVDSISVTEDSISVTEDVNLASDPIDISKFFAE